MRVAVSSSHIVSAASSSSHSSPAPAWGPSHRRQFSTKFSYMGPSHRLQFSTNCSSVGPFHGVQSFRGHKSCHQTCFGVGSSLHRSCQEILGATSSTCQARREELRESIVEDAGRSATYCAIFSKPLLTRSLKGFQIN